MAGKALIGTIVGLVVALYVIGSILGGALMAVNNSATLTDNGVPASTVALYALIGLLAVVAVIMLLLRVGTG